MGEVSKHASKLEGLKILIFGGSSGLGYAAAEACIENGATVILSSSSQQKIDHAIGRIAKTYPSREDRVSGYACNLGDKTVLEENLKELFQKIGKVDHISLFHKSTP